MAGTKATREVCLPGLAARPLLRKCCHRLLPARANMHAAFDPAPATGSGRSPDEARDRDAGGAGDLLIREIVENCPDAIYLLDPAGRIMFINKSAIRSFGIADPEAMIGKRWTDQLPPSLVADGKRLIARAAKGERATTVAETLEGGRRRWWDVEATPVCRQDPVNSRILVLAREVTQRKEAEAQILWAAQHDVVTGLPNRAALQDALATRIREAEQTGTRLTMFLLDVDNFKQTNDTLGHDAGDALLREFARRLVDTLRPTDFVARLGGDEFAVLRAGDIEEAEVMAVGEGVLAALRAPFAFAERVIDCQASIGAAIYPQHARSGSELFKSADMALYAAKRAGRGCLSIFCREFRQEVQRRMSMISLARQAIGEDRIIPYYQPKVCLRTGEIIGFEALLRWQHPTRGIQLPGRIEAAFHDHGLALAISDRMVERVLLDIANWRERGIPYRHVAVNASAAEFRSGNFAERLLERLHAAHLPTSSIQLEVTETVFLGRGAECVDKALKLLSREGVMIALDDFGTGYASLSHLKQFPVDIIKIDRSFVSNLHSHPDDGAIVAAVINLGRSLGIRVVAEGIENEAQHHTLLALGCDFGQGFLYGRAQPAPGTVKLLASPELPNLRRRQRVIEAACLERKVA